MVNVLISLFTRLGFYQCCIRCCFLALRWRLVNLWRGLFDLPAVPVSQTWWARKFLPLLCCRADSSSLDFPACRCFSLMPESPARSSLPWLLGMVNLRPSDQYWDLLPVGVYVLGTPIFLWFLLAHFMCSPYTDVTKYLLRLHPLVPHPSYLLCFWGYSNCDFSKDPFTWSSQPVFCLFVKWDCHL